MNEFTKNQENFMKIKRLEAYLTLTWNSKGGHINRILEFCPIKMNLNRTKSFFMDFFLNQIRTRMNI